MKKLLAILLSVIMVLSLVACGNKTQGETPSNDDQQQNTETETKTIKVGLICIGDENDQGYTYNFYRAKDSVTEKMAAKGVTLDWNIITNIGEDDGCTDACVELAEAGCDVVICNSYGHEPYMLKAAPDYPNVQFIGCTNLNSQFAGLDNCHNAFANIYEGRYLAGIAAGMKLNAMIKEGKFEAKDAKIGYVGAFPYAEVKSGYTAFFLGVRSVCKEATMEVQFTGSWYDEAKEKEAATLLIGRGCKLISQHADSMGAPTACENAGVPNVSYNGSTLDACPNTFIVSSRINWVPYMKYMIECVRDGKEIDTDWCKGINEGAVELTAINEKVAAPGTAEAIKAAEEQFKAGTLHVFDTSTFTVGGKVLTSYKADVDTDENYTPDTEVVSNGYFHESEKRSAPYFDVDIDGITLLNK